MASCSRNSKYTHTHTQFAPSVLVWATSPIVAPGIAQFADTHTQLAPLVLVWATLPIVAPGIALFADTHTHTHPHHTDNCAVCLNKHHQASGTLVIAVLDPYTTVALIGALFAWTKVGLARTMYIYIYIYIRCIYGIFGREITVYTVIYGAYIRFWPTVDISHQIFETISVVSLLGAAISCSTHLN